MTELDFRAIAKDLREQLNSVADTLIKLTDRVNMLKAKLVHHVDQGEGMTHEELVEVYGEIERLFPRRVRKISESLDSQS